jgi:uncharacterized protein YbjT (DUF2867 family)
MREKKGRKTADEEKEEASLLDRINPFKAGQSLRRSIDTALTSIATPSERKSRFYLDERLLDFAAATDYGGRSAAAAAASLSAAADPGSRLAESRGDGDYFVPEVLVVGATGEVGRLVVRRLLLSRRFRVRVLVRDLYTKTLNLLGTGVTYCQGDLSNTDSLEYAVTDVDKIVFCAAAPRPDEDQFRNKFQEFMRENLVNGGERVELVDGRTDDGDSTAAWERLGSVLEVRAQLAEQVDLIGMRNLVRAYQNVRHADYGTSQAAKRSLFKFQSRPEDFNLFAIDEGGDDKAADVKTTTVGASSTATSTYDSSLYDAYDEDEDEDEEDDDDEEDYYGDYEEYEEEFTEIEKREDASVQTQSQWIRNQFGHGVFVGRVPKSTAAGIGGEAAIVSSRFRSRDDPDSGIDLGPGFAGFIWRVCSDGGTYEAFVRPGAYEESGIEYVCEFSTSTKPTGRNKSRNRFSTIRLPFEKFRPVRRKEVVGTDVEEIPPFRGRDVRNIGFRYRSASNELKSKLTPGEWNSFYLALCYIKLYRSQPEPEFVYVSDARIPPVVRDGMVRHDARQVLSEAPTKDRPADVIRILDESTISAAQDHLARSPEETYYKFRGEEILKKSGLSYSIIRVLGFNESPAAEASTIELTSSDADLTAVSRADLAQVCVSALMDPSALNKSYYISMKRKSTSKDEDMSAKFSQLPADAVV